MSFFFGGGGKKVKPQYTGLATQTSTSNIPIAIMWGKNRLAPNIIWQGDFKAHKQKQKSGKGGGGSVTTYTYSGSYELAICWGPIVGIPRVWKDQSKETSYAALGWSLFLGINPQAPWGYLVTAHPTEALGYPDIAYLAAANYDLGASNALQQHSFEVEGPLLNTQVDGSGDADPAQIIDDFLNNVKYGVAATFDDIIDADSLYSGPNAGTTGDAAFQTYCRAMGFGLSPALISQSKASSIMENWAELCNTAIVYTGYSLKFIPYGDDTVTAHGVTFLPDVTIQYELDDTVFKPRGDDADPITFDRVDPADAYNSLTITIKNRDNEYNDLPVEWRDQGLVDQYGLQNADAVDAYAVCVPDMAAKMVALMGMRVAYVRNTFNFVLPVSFCRLEPMDIVQCYDPRFGTFLVRIKEINETDNDEYEITAWEYMTGAVTNPSGEEVAQPVDNNPINTATPAGPVNPPILFEPPSSLTGGVAQVWAAVSGGDGTTVDENWGGCFVWISTDDITYNQIGDIDTPARQGKLTSVLNTYGGVNPDTTDTLEVDMGMSAGELSDASAADAEAGVTVSYVESASGYELLSYEAVTLTGTDLYDLDTLWRHQFGSTVASHAIGADFARLDDAVFKYNLPEAYIGQTIYLKFQSYNIFGGGVEDLSSVTSYPYVPTGIGYGGGTAGAPTTTTGLSSSSGTTYARITWTVNPANDNITLYQVWRATGSGQPFGSAAQIGTTTGAEYTDTAVTGGQAYTYFVVAVNAVGSATASSGVNATPTAAVVVNPFGFAFSQGDPVISKPIAYFDSPLAWTMPINLTDSQGSLGNSTTQVAVAPSAQTDFDIQSPPGSSVGTMRFAASAVVATFIKAASSSIPLGQAVAIIAPANLNGMKGKIYGSIIGTR